MIFFCDGLNCMDDANKGNRHHYLVDIPEFYKKKQVHHCNAYTKCNINNM